MATSGGIIPGISTLLPFVGQAYTIERSAPMVSIGVPATSRVLANAVDYVVTYSDPNFAASTLAASDVTLNATGTASGTVSVSGTGNSRIVTISSIAGSGTLGISLAAGTANDLAGNNALAAGPSTTFSVPLPTPPTLITPAVTNLGANSATLALQSTATGTGYFTLLPGNNATCGTGTQTKAGQDNLGNPAFRIGSLPLTAGTTGYYTVRNLSQGTLYTVCFTAEDNRLALQPLAVSTRLSTTATASPTAPVWNLVGNSGFSAGQVYYTSLTFAPDGTPYLAYSDGGNSSKAMVMKYSGGAWANVGSAGFSAGAVYYTSLAFAPDGTPYVAYRDNGNSFKATVMKYSGGAWANVGSAGFSAGSATYTSLVFAPDGTPYVAYSNESNSSKTTVMKYSGGAWTNVGNAGFSAGSATYNSLVFAPDGTLYVAYSDGGNSSKTTVMKYSGGAWANVGNAGFTAGSATYSSLVFAPDGTPYVAYSDGGNSSKAMVMKYSGGAWANVGSAGLSAGAAYYTSLAFAPDGTPYVAYRDNGNSSKATVMKFSGGAWANVGSAGFSAGSATYTSLVFAPDGTPFVAYSDGSNSSKATVMKLVETAPSVVTNEATKISATGATLNGMVNDNGTTTIVAFDYDLTPDYGSSASGGTVTAGSGPTPVSTAISGLTCNTTYHFRVNATNSVGTTNGLDATFTTSACPIFSPAATTGTVSSVTTSSATLNGTISSNGAATTVTFD
jgi:hypothetical protein